MNLIYDFVAKVVDVKDPEKAGRLKIRILGTQDDTAKIPDSDLMWARCLFPVTSAMHGGVASSTTGAVVGTIVVGRYMDAQKQIPIIIGTLGKAGSSSNTTVTSTTTSNTTPSQSSDFPRANVGDDHNAVLNKNIIQLGHSGAISAIEKTVGSIARNRSISGALSAIGEGQMTDILGRIDSIKGKIKMLKSAINSVGAVGDIGSLISVATAGLGAELGQVGAVANTILHVTSTGNIIPVNNSTVTSVAAGVLTAVTGEQNIGASIGSIAGQLAGDLQNIGSVSGAIKMVNGLSFQMNTNMKGIESAFSSIKALKQQKLAQLESVVSTVQNTVTQAKNVINV